MFLRNLIILALVAVSRGRGRPPSRWGALGAAALILLTLDPSRLASPGFQLSFAAVVALIAGAWLALNLGAGPGDPELITVKAQKLIDRCPDDIYGPFIKVTGKC